MARMMENSAVFCGALLTSVALANPTGGTVTAGQATIQQNGGTLQVTTTTQSTTISWQTFSIGAGETANFTQPSSSSVVVNNITTQNASQILGSLTSNGQVFLINPNGVVFGSGSQVSVAGLNVTTNSGGGAISGIQGPLSISTYGNTGSVSLISGGSISGNIAATSFVSTSSAGVTLGFASVGVTGTTAGGGVYLVSSSTPSITGTSTTGTSTAGAAGATVQLSAKASMPLSTSAAKAAGAVTTGMIVLQKNEPNY